MKHWEFWINIVKNTKWQEKYGSYISLLENNVINSVPSKYFLEGMTMELELGQQSPSYIPQRIK